MLGVGGIGTVVGMTGVGVGGGSSAELGTTIRSRSTLIRARMCLAP